MTLSKKHVSGAISKLPTRGSTSGEGHETHVTAMGFCMVRGPQGEGLAYLHPNALTQAWKLKQGPPLKTPKCQHAGYVPAILTGALAAKCLICW